ncbi:hypothetical protein [Acinetobacter baumannii]|uniref:hypothetical protein n=1 Tax=Acinetobacter baumannii TaxID=470 RepID=UPI001D172848|nr:hypothetical protein [Acinetobacter baumannii]
MDKYKVIAEKITYSLDGYIADHNNRNFGDADGWLRHVRNGWEEFIEAHPNSLNLHEYLQHHQAKVEELQRRNQMLNDNIKEQGQKLVYQNEVIETQAEKLLGLRDEKAELQKRVKWLEDRLKATDTLSKMRAAVIGSFKTQDFNACTRRKMMILKRAEQALKVGEN